MSLGFRQVLVPFRDTLSACQWKKSKLCSPSPDPIDLTRLIPFDWRGRSLITPGVISLLGLAAQCDVRSSLLLGHYDNWRQWRISR